MRSARWCPPGTGLQGDLQIDTVGVAWFRIVPTATSGWAASTTICTMLIRSVCTRSRTRRAACLGHTSAQRIPRRGTTPIFSPKRPMRNNSASGVSSSAGMLGHTEGAARLGNRDPLGKTSAHRRRIRRHSYSAWKLNSGNILRISRKEGVLRVHGEEGIRTPKRRLRWVQPKRNQPPPNGGGFPFGGLLGDGNILGNLRESGWAGRGN